MKRKKALIALAIAVLLLASVFAGCSKDEPTPETSTEVTQATNAPDTEETDTTGETVTDPETGFAADADTFPIVAEPMTMKVLALAARSEVEDWSTNSVTQYWQDKTGVTFEWETVVDVGDTSASKQKLGVIMASGNLPDIILSGSSAFTQEQAISYGAQGLVIPLNTLIDQYGVNTKILYEYDPSVENSITAPDGNIYFLPSYTSNAQAHTSLLQRCMINTTWLENLGLEMPTTTEDFYNVLKAFKDEDANGNGDPDDEIPLVTWKSNYTGFDTFLMNSFQFNSGKLYERLMTEDGVVLPAYTQEGWKEGLRYMRKLYEEDLADKEIFLTTRDQLKMYTGDQDGNRVGACLTYSYSSFIDLSSEIVNDYEFLSPLEGPTGLRQATYIESWIEPNFYITASCENPEVAFRVGDALMFDALSDPTLAALDGVYGPEGEGWAKAEEGETGLDGVTPAQYKWLFTFGEPNNINWHEYGLVTRRSDWKLLMVAEQGEWNQEALLYKAAMDLYKPYAVNKAVPSTLMFESDKVSEVSQLKETINTYVEESISKFVTGTWDIDADWDSYINELNTIGLEHFVELYQEAYTRQFGQ
jgi:putative aldouronate transport system substrate-binding protein